MSLSPTEIQQLADAIVERLSRRATTPAMLDAHGAAELLGCSVPTIERLTKSGAIPSKKIGRLRRYWPDDLIALRSEKGGVA